MKPGILLQEEGEAMDYDRLLNLTTDLGYQLMASGAEIYRVEAVSYTHLTLPTT